MTREQYESLFIDMVSALSDEAITGHDDVLIEIEDISAHAFEIQNEVAVSEGTEVLIEFESALEEDAENEKTDRELTEESDIYTE